jgi:hypothetical protein
MSDVPNGDGRSPVPPSPNPVPNSPGTGWPGPFHLGELFRGFDCHRLWHRNAAAGMEDWNGASQAILIRVPDYPENHIEAPIPVSALGANRHIEDWVIYQDFSSPEEKESRRARMAAAFPKGIPDIPWVPEPVPKPEPVRVYSPPADTTTPEAVKETPKRSPWKDLFAKVEKVLLERPVEKPPTRAELLDLLDQSLSVLLEREQEWSRVSAAREKEWNSHVDALEKQREMEDVSPEAQDEPQEKELWEHLREYAAAAAAAIPASRINSAITPIVRAWLREDHVRELRGWKSEKICHWLPRDDFQGLFDREGDQDSLFDQLAYDSVRAALASLPDDSRWWLFVYAELKGTEHVQQPPAPLPRGKGEPREYAWPGCTPLAVIQWPCEASQELLRRLVLEAMKAGGTGGGESPALPQSKRRRGGPKPIPDTKEDLEIIRLYNTGDYPFRDDLAKRVGKDKAYVEKVIDRYRQRVKAEKRPSGA